MTSVKLDPYLVTSGLITDAISTARVFGENRKINTLVASSIKRFMADMDDGESLLDHAMAYINAEDARFVPTLVASLQGMSFEQDKDLD